MASAAASPSEAASAAPYIIDPSLVGTAGCGVPGGFGRPAAAPRVQY